MARGRAVEQQNEREHTPRRRHPYALAQFDDGMDARRNRHRLPHIAILEIDVSESTCARRERNALVGGGFADEAMRDRHDRIERQIAEQLRPDFHSHAPAFRHQSI